MEISMLKGSTSFSTAPLGCLQKVVGVSSETSDSLCHLATQKGGGGGCSSLGRVFL